METLREVVEALAPLEREAGSEGEREAAEWLAARLEQAGAPARVEEEEFLDGWPEPARGAHRRRGGLWAARADGGGRDARAIAGGAAAAALIADEASNGAAARCAARSASARRPGTWSPSSATRKPSGPSSSIAHHDAAHGGRAFDQTFQRKLADWFPGVIERVDTAIPIWWGVAAGPALAALGALTRRRGLAAAGAALSAVSTAMLRRHRPHPGRPGRQRQPERGRGAGRARRGC